MYLYNSVEYIFLSDPLVLSEFPIIRSPGWQSGNTLASHLWGRGFGSPHGLKWESW